MIIETKLKAGRYLVKTTLIYRNNRIYLEMPFNRDLINEIKSMEGPKWHGYDNPPTKIWSIKDTARNRFQLDYLQKKNPYKVYDAPLVEYETLRPVYEHQLTMIKHGLTRHYCIWACEMGTGKTLPAIEIMEQSGADDSNIWYVGPKSGVKAVELELKKWKSKVIPRMFTYETLIKIMKNWDSRDQTPKVVIFDESSKIKTPTAQRSQAAAHLANAVRKEHGDNGYVILMSGTPAPKSPVDWWHQAEVACPGFIKEGTYGKFKKSLCLIEQRQSITGGVYPHLITWLDDETKCKICGQQKEHENHDPQNIINDIFHNYVKSTNEIERLYKRLKGLVLIQFKKDCLDLPEKQYRIIKVKPDVDTLRTAKSIAATASRTIQALTLLRELSDGFQYTEERRGELVCRACCGAGKITAPVPKNQVDIMAPQDVKSEDFINKEIICDYCGGVGKVPDYVRGIENVKCPKDSVFIDLLDEHEDTGRFIVWGGFTGTIDRLVNISHQQGWITLRVDGRGYYGESPTGEILDADELLIAMDASHPRKAELLDKYPRICFVGHPQAGGMALTLTASPTELFYSNSFSGEARMQAEDRFHRAGMDVNRGATIIDLIHLPTDKLVLKNLQKKKKLQSLSMGDIASSFREDS